VVRSAHHADAPVLARLATELGYTSSSEDLQPRLDFLLTSPEHEVLVFDDGAVLGWIGVVVAHSLTSPPHGEVIGLVVDESARSAGIGGQLMEAAERWVRERGCGSITVRTNVVRQDAHRFYERIGYGKVKEQRVYQKPL
jgi:GNAT superfamily N-acetyltransferase